jgi:hypothetical protein
MADRIAVSQRLALRMFYMNGFNDPIGLENALARIQQMPAPTAGYVYADDVPAAIEALKAEAL